MSSKQFGLERHLVCFFHDTSIIGSYWRILSNVRNSSALRIIDGNDENGRIYELSSFYVLEFCRHLMKLIQIQRN